MVKASSEFGSIFASSTLRVVIGAEGWRVSYRSGVAYDLALESVGPEARWVWPCGTQAAPARVLMPYLFLSLIQNKGCEERNVTRALQASSTVQPRPYFAAFALSHCEGFRPAFVTLMAAECPGRTVHALSRLCNVTGATMSPHRLTPRFAQQSYLTSVRNAIAMYKFAIVFENSETAGYVTEKIANARLAGAVPVWFGTAAIYRWVRPSAFIDCTPRAIAGVREPTKLAWRRCIEQIAHLDRNSSAWDAMVNDIFWVDPALGEPLTPYLSLMLSLAGLGKWAPADRDAIRRVARDVYLPRTAAVNSQPGDVIGVSGRPASVAVRTWVKRGQQHCKSLAMEPSLPSVWDGVVLLIGVISYNRRSSWHRREAIRAACGPNDPRAALRFVMAKNERPPDAKSDDMLFFFISRRDREFIAQFLLKAEFLRYATTGPRRRIPFIAKADDDSFYNASAIALQLASLPLSMRGGKAHVAMGPTVNWYMYDSTTFTPTCWSSDGHNRWLQARNERLASMDRGATHDKHGRPIVSDGQCLRPGLVGPFPFPRGPFQAYSQATAHLLTELLSPNESYVLDRRRKMTLTHPITGKIVGRGAIVCPAPET